jgi:hypothetical protein
MSYISEGLRFTAAAVAKTAVSAPDMAAQGTPVPSARPEQIRLRGVGCVRDDDGVV